MDGWMDGWTDRRTDGWIDGWMDGWMDLQIDGWYLLIVDTCRLCTVTSLNCISIDYSSYNRNKQEAESK